MGVKDRHNSYSRIVVFTAAVFKTHVGCDALMSPKRRRAVVAFPLLTVRLFEPRSDGLPAYTCNAAGSQGGQIVCPPGSCIQTQED